MVLFFVVMLILYVFFCWVLIYKFGLGYCGVVFVSGILCWLNMLLFVFYVKFFLCFRRIWMLFLRELFNDFLVFFKLVVFFVLMMCFEYWFF